jgi:cell division protein FtsN
MTHDFAKRHTTMNSGAPSIPGWVWFITGLAAGIFISFLAYLGKIVPSDPQTTGLIVIPKAEPDQIVEEMQFDFYDLFPRSVVPIVEEYNTEDLRAESEGHFAYLLQAGSFPHPDDADQLRAKLILLGMEVFVKKIKIDGKKWYRVMVGPIATDLELNRTQDRLAEAEIESIPLKVSK